MFYFWRKYGYERINSVIEICVLRTFISATLILKNKGKKATNLKLKLPVLGKPVKQIVNLLPGSISICGWKNSTRKNTSFTHIHCNFSLPVKRKVSGLIWKQKVLLEQGTLIMTITVSNLQQLGNNIQYPNYWKWRVSLIQQALISLYT